METDADLATGRARGTVRKHRQHRRERSGDADAVPRRRHSSLSMSRAAVLERRAMSIDRRSADGRAAEERRKRARDRSCSDHDAANPAKDIDGAPSCGDIDRISEERTPTIEGTQSPESGRVASPTDEAAAAETQGGRTESIGVQADAERRDRPQVADRGVQPELSLPQRVSAFWHC